MRSHGTAGPRSGTSPSGPTEQLGVPARWYNIIWALLVLNVMGFSGPPMVVEIPRVIGQLLTMGSLFVAFGIALRLNPRIQLRPNTYLVVMTALALLAVISSIEPGVGKGTLFRCFRLAVFVATLWLLSKWWAAQDMRTARIHLTVLGITLGSVLLGALLAPDLAFANRLRGVIWPIAPTQVGAYGAIVVGMAVVMWMTHTLDTRSALLLAIPALGLMLLSQTRTALIGLAVGFALASGSIFMTSSRARAAITTVLALGTLGYVFLADVLWTYFLREQDTADDLADLSGRQKVWDSILAYPRTPMEELIGIGVANKSFGGLPIDSTWMATYHELGLVGIAIVASLLIALVVAAVRRPPSPARALAIFLIAFCAVSSYTEVGLSDASPYLLHLTVAASLLVPAARTARPPTGTVDRP